MSEAEVIREGIRMVERVVLRKEGIEVLLELAKIPGDDAKTRFK